MTTYSKNLAALANESDTMGFRPFGTIDLPGSGLEYANQARALVDVLASFTEAEENADAKIYAFALRGIETLLSLADLARAAETMAAEGAAS